MGRNRHDICGNKYGKLLVVGLENQNGTNKWKCQCDCGNIVYFQALGVKCQKKSCGCLNKNKNIRKDPKVFNKICKSCDKWFETENGTKLCCSASCASKLKFIRNPELRNLYAEIGKNTMKMLHETGKANTSKPGMHTQKFIENLIARMTGKKFSDDVRQKIKDNHWARDPEKCKITIEKLIIQKEVVKVGIR